MHTVTVKPRKENSELYGFSVSTQVPVSTALSYSQLMGKLNAKEIGLNRKVLADLAMNHPEAFKAIVDAVK